MQNCVTFIDGQKKLQVTNIYKQQQKFNSENKNSLCFRPSSPLDAKSSRQESHVIPLECRHRNLTANGCSPRQSIHSRDALLSLVPVPSVHVLHRTDIGLWWKTLTSKSPRLGTLEVSLQDPGLKKWLLQQKDTSPNFAFSPLFFKFLLLFRFLLFASSSAAFL